jgi:phosphatidylserine/phosphatidylglycerophosphate/cardiolipin synthase-like enzyme
MALTNKTPAIDALLPWLLKRRVDDDGTAVDELRPAFVRNGVPGTYRIHADYPTTSTSTWKYPDGQFSQTSTNEVEFFADGGDTYAAMLEAMATATSSDHTIVIMGWTLFANFALTSSSRSPFGNATLRQVIEDRLKNHQCSIRILIWQNPAPGSEAGAELAALHDFAQKGGYGDRLVSAMDNSSQPHTNPIIPTAQHQKIVLVRGSEGLVGFWGGVDFNPDRVKAGKGTVSAGQGRLHDVHARVTGPAAERLLSIAIDRWNYMIGRITSGMGSVGLAGQSMAVITFCRGPNYPVKGNETVLEDADAWRGPAEDDKDPGYAVQFLQTSGNRYIAEKMRPDAWPAVKKCIENAKRLVYVEDQYFWAIPFADAVAAAANRGVRVIVLLPPHDSAEGKDLRLRAFARLHQQCSRDGLVRVEIYELASKEHFYVHSKMGVVDDEACWIGSMNQNNRGHVHDGEVVATIADLPWKEASGARAGLWSIQELNFAHKLRIALWSEHLGLHPSEAYDGLASRWRWWYRPGRVKKYTVDNHYWKTAAAKEPEVGPIPESTVFDPLPEKR